MDEEAYSFSLPTKTYPMIIIPDFPEIQVEEVEVACEITLTLHTTSPTASCPSCGVQSSHIQSRYTRTLRDLPSIGHPIRAIASKWGGGKIESKTVESKHGRTAPIALGNLFSSNRGSASRENKTPY